MSEAEFDEYSWADFRFVSTMLEKENAARRKDLLIGAAFTAWLQGAGPEKTFEQFLRHYGLVEKEAPMDPNAKKIAIEKAKRISARIMAMDKKRRPKK